MTRLTIAPLVLILALPGMASADEAPVLMSDAEMDRIVAGLAFQVILSTPAKDNAPDHTPVGFLGDAAEQAADGLTKASLTPSPVSAGG